MRAMRSEAFGAGLAYAGAATDDQRHAPGQVE
jgi:hypothetical protein